MGCVTCGLQAMANQVRAPHDRRRHKRKRNGDRSLCGVSGNVAEMPSLYCGVSICILSNQQIGQFHSCDLAGPDGTTCWESCGL